MSYNVMEYTKRDCNPWEITRPRHVTLDLSDSDIEVLCGKAAIIGMTVENLLSQFASDLVFGSTCSCEQDSLNAVAWYKNHSCNDSSAGPTYCKNSFIYYLFHNGSLAHYAYIMDDISCFVSELSFPHNDPEHNRSFAEDLEAAEEIIMDDYMIYAESAESPQTMIEAISDLIKFSIRLNKLLDFGCDFSC